MSIQDMFKRCDYKPLPNSPLDQVAKAKELLALAEKASPGKWLHSSTVLVCDETARVIANCTPIMDAALAKARP